MLFSEDVTVKPQYRSERTGKNDHPRDKDLRDDINGLFDLLYDREIFLRICRSKKTWNHNKKPCLK